MLENIKCLFTNFPWDILWMLLLPLLLLWWYMNSRLNKAMGTIEELRERNEYLEKELQACRIAKVANLETSNQILTGNQISANSNTGIGIANAGNETNIKKDDLKIVEGIGPKIEELFFKANIFTFEQLSQTSIDKMKEILDAAGPRFQMHDPTTWADQAALARDDKWDELKKWQDELNKGRLT